MVGLGCCVEMRSELSGACTTSEDVNAEDAGTCLLGLAGSVSLISFATRISEPSDSIPRSLFRCWMLLESPFVVGLALVS